VPSAPYITLSELAESLSLTESFADDDMTQAILAASAEVDRRCDRTFGVDGTPSTRYYTPEASLIVFIDDLTNSTTPVVSVDLGLDGTFSQTLTLYTDFMFEPLNATADGVPFTTIRVDAQRSSAYFPLAPRTVRVTGTFGWPAVPPGVKEATAILAARFMKRVREAPFGVAGFGIDGSAVRIGQYDPDVDALLAKFVRTNHAF